MRHEAKCGPKRQAASPRRSWFDERAAPGLNYALTAKMYL